MDTDPQDQQMDEDSIPNPLPTGIDQDMDMTLNADNENDLIPLPIDESATNDIDNDTEMKDTTNTTELTLQTEAITIDEAVIEEEEEEGGIIEEEEESGDIIAPPPQPTQDTNTNTNTNAQSKPKEDKDRARSHPITTNTQEGPRYLNIHLMSEWNNGEVLQWLTHRFGLWGQQYVPVFSNNKTEGAQLINLSAEDLKQVYKVTKPLHLVRMCRDISDAQRALHQITQLIAPQYIDGGNAASKLMRFGPKEVYTFSTRIPLLKLHAQTFLDRQINGRVLLECTDVQLVTAMKNESITLLDAQGILEFIEQIKKEASITDANSNEYLPIQAVYDVWTEMCKISEIRFKLLPQHIRDYSKPAPTYYPPPQQQQYQYGQGTHHKGMGNGYSAYNKSGMGMGMDEEERQGTPPLYEQKSVTEWNTEDCIVWLGQIKESKVDLRVRYTPHFEQIKMTGLILLNMTPSTLSSICCITTKTHLKQLVKAIDKIRDHLIFNGFGQQSHVKEFTRKYGGGYSMPAQRYGGPDAYRESGTKQRKAKKRDRAVKDSTVNGNGNAKRDESATKCFVCGKTGNVMRCSQCKSAFYCSRDHQVSDWARHSKECQKQT